jgi:hypothetical protein
MVSDIRYLIYKYFMNKIHNFIQYDLTTGRIHKQKVAYTENEIVNFLNNNRQNINNTITDLVDENEITDLENAEKVSDEIIKVILYDYVLYEE